MFGWLSGWVRDFLRPLISTLVDRRGRALAEYAMTAVQNLETSELSGKMRRDIVMESLRNEARAMGMEIKDHILAAILESALARYRDK
jgi:hypothetical protein